jgi:membrane-associated phospholipid phosphatase
LAGEHWPSDIVGGYMAGALALGAIIWLYRRVRTSQSDS